MAVRPLARPLARPLSAPGAGYRPVLGGGNAPLDIAGWAFAGSALDLDLQNNLAAINQISAGTATSQLAVTRATSGYGQSQNGIWTLFTSGQFRQTDKGLLVEEARTNNLLWCRDMTNAAWVKGATATVALTQTGIDGLANSASLITGGAVQATNTVLQTITLGSATDTYSVWLKRVTGSGTVEITPDGSTWTAVVLTAAYQQFQVTQAAIVNPVCGIRLQTNGDQIAADFSQLETGAFATSPILTTTVAATRNADVVQVIGAGATSIPLSASAFTQTVGVEGITVQVRMLTLGNDYLGSATLSQVRAFDGTNSVSTAIGGSGSMIGLVKAAFGLDNASMTAIANGGAVATQVSNSWAAQAAGQTPYLGNRSAGDRALNGYLQRAAFALPKGIFNNSTSP